MKKENFFTAYLMGGLGNQMFQIAHTYAQGLKYNTKVIFKPEAYTPMQAKKPTKYLNNIYAKLSFENFDYDLSRINCGWDFEEITIPSDTNIEFYGYFQSSKNFYNFKNEIKFLFEPSDLFKKLIVQKYPELKKENNISLHIRRGDYLQISKILPPLDISYFDHCINKIDKYENIFVFSDDLNWAKENLKYKNIIFIDNLEDYEELWMISLCRTNIMSNSTFSWWGSFLNTNPNKVTFVPDTWFGPSGQKNYQDIYETDWTKIKTKFKNDKIICC